jgi:ribosomal protein L24E
MRTYDDTFSGEKIYPGKVWIIYLGEDGRWQRTNQQCLEKDELRNWVRKQMES